MEYKTKKVGSWCFKCKNIHQAVRVADMEYLVKDDLKKILGSFYREYKKDPWTVKRGYPYGPTPIRKEKMADAIHYILKGE